MIRVFCDLCAQEILSGGCLSFNFSRRVQLSRISLFFTFEYLSGPKPDHVCLVCAIGYLQEAIKVLRETETENV